MTRGTQTLPYETLEEYVDRLRREDAFFSLTDPAWMDIYSRAQEAIVQSLYRLDKLPRPDSFWDNTNKQPRLARLGEFVGKLLHENPDDVDALWCAAALCLYSYSNDFGVEEWKRLYQRGQCDVRYPVFAAHRVMVGTGCDTSVRLRELLQELGVIDEVRHDEIAWPDARI